MILRTSHQASDIWHPGNINLNYTKNANRHRWRNKFKERIMAKIIKQSNAKDYYKVAYK